MADDQNQNNTGGEQSPPALPTPKGRGWISVRQFAALMERDYRTVLRWVHEERVQCVMVGGQKRIYEDEVRFILENGTRPPNPVKLGTFGHSGKLKDRAAQNAGNIKTGDDT